jgi:hypothetical protein
MKFGVFTSYALAFAILGLLPFMTFLAKAPNSSLTPTHRVQIKLLLGNEASNQIPHLLNGSTTGGYVTPFIDFSLTQV